MSDSLPEYVLTDIKEHIHTECKNAELIRASVFEKEDSITASILARLGTPKWRGSKDKQWKIDIYIPSNQKTKDDSEPNIGADGIIQIAVYGTDGSLEFTKGILFQAKKSTITHREKLNEQIEKMESVAGSEGCAVLIYDLEKGYKGVSVSELDGKSLNDPHIGKSLEDFIANDFLDCKVGKRDLYHSLKTPTLFGTIARPINTKQIPLKFILNITVRKWGNTGKVKRLKNSGKKVRKR